MEKKIKCLVVDDDPTGKKLIEGYVNRTPGLELTASCKNAFEVMDRLQSESVDILFSDIQMPELNGLELVKSLPHPPAIIFITAYNNFASDSYDLNVIDYLLKPVSYERFLKAVNKAIAQIAAKKTTTPAATINKAGYKNPYIFVRTGNEYLKIGIEDIMYLEAAANFVLIHISANKNPVMVHTTMTDMEKELPADKFFRIHKSYLVAISHIKKLMGNVIILFNDKELAVAQARKEELYKILHIQPFSS